MHLCLQNSFRNGGKSDKCRGEREIFWTMQSRDTLGTEFTIILIIMILFVCILKFSFILYLLFLQLNDKTNLKIK